MKWTDAFGGVFAGGDYQQMLGPQRALSQEEMDRITRLRAEGVANVHREPQDGSIDISVEVVPEMSNVLAVTDGKVYQVTDEGVAPVELDHG